MNHGFAIFLYMIVKDITKKEYQTPLIENGFKQLFSKKIG